MPLFFFPCYIKSRPNNPPNGLNVHGLALKTRKRGWVWTWLIVRGYGTCIVHLVGGYGTVKRMAYGRSDRTSTNQIQPWLRSKSTQQVITYDDPESLWMKGNLVKHYKLLGVSLFSIDGDNEEGVLMASVRHGMGLEL